MGGGEREGSGIVWGIVIILRSVVIFYLTRSRGERRCGRGLWGRVLNKGMPGMDYTAANRDELG